MKPLPVKSVEKKDIYIKESLKLFLKYGIKTVTVGQITAKLNISSKTLYLIFGDKTALVSECFALYRLNYDKEYEQIKSEAVNVADMLIQFYNKSIESLTRINPNFFNDISRYFPEMWNSAEAFGYRHTRELLEQGVSEGIFVSSIDMDLCAETLTLLLRSMFDRESFSETSTRKLLTNVMWPYVRGICTESGMVEFRKHRRFVAGV